MGRVFPTRTRGFSASASSRRLQHCPRIWVTERAPVRVEEDPGESVNWRRRFPGRVDGRGEEVLSGLSPLPIFGAKSGDRDSGRRWIGGVGVVHRGNREWVAILDRRRWFVGGHSTSGERRPTLLRGTDAKRRSVAVAANREPVDLGRQRWRGGGPVLGRAEVGERRWRLGRPPATTGRITDGSEQSGPFFILRLVVALRNHYAPHGKCSG